MYRIVSKDLFDKLFEQRPENNKRELLDKPEMRIPDRRNTR